MYCFHQEIWILCTCAFHSVPIFPSMPLLGTDDNNILSSTLNELITYVAGGGRGKGIGGGREGNGGSSSELHLGSVSRQIVVAVLRARSRVGEHVSEFFCGLSSPLRELQRFPQLACVCPLIPHVLCRV